MRIDQSDYYQERALLQFDDFVEVEVLAWMKQCKLKAITLENAGGDKATIRVDKHGFFKVRYTKIKDNL